MLFIAKITFKKTLKIEDQVGIALFDNNLRALDAETVVKGNIGILTTKISLPGKLIIAANIDHDGDRVELERFSLAGIDVDKSILLNCLEYKYSPEHAAIQTMKQLNDLESHKTLCWHHNGYAIINIFHPNPFAWHLYLGNKIKI